MELTAPTCQVALKSASMLMALTRSWQSSKTPSTATLTLLESRRENIWARWNAVMRPAGVSMTTERPRRPRSAYSAEEPVSPEVAPTMVSQSSRRVSSYSKSSPRSCIAMSLKAAVGPFDRWAMCRSVPSRAVTGTICGSEKAGVE